MRRAAEHHSNPLSVATASRRLVAGFALAGAALASMAAIAQEPPVLTLRIVPTSDQELQARLFSSLAKYARNTQVPVEAGRTVDEVVRQRCGFISNPLRAVILRANSGLSFAADGKPRTVELPPCPYWRFLVRVDISTIHKLSTLVFLKTGFNGQGTMQQVATRNPGFVDRSGNLLRKTGTLELPYESRAFSLFLRADAGTPERVALALARDFPTLLRDNYVRNYVEQGSGTSFRVNSILSGSAYGPGACPARNVDWPFNSDRIADALLVNQRYATPGTRYAKGIVLIADTGLRVADQTRFPLWFNAGEYGPNAQAGADNDGNGYVYDLHGANMNRDPGFPAAVENFSDADHGTQVANMIVGPWVGARLRSLLHDRVQIALANVVDTQVSIGRDGSTSYRTDITPGMVERAFGYASYIRPASVVLNMSLRSHDPFPMIGNLIAASPVLSVMAAGNDGQKIDLANKQVYPVAYRSEANGLMLTVAAHDADGRLAAFSNHGRRMVDIAAPGCALETYSFEGQKVTSSGTSLAAPLVSMTAALLYGEGLVNPRQIRNRILATADFDAALKPAVYASGRLNMEKALRFNQDIIVPLQGDGKPGAPKFGHIVQSSSIPICGDQMSLRNVLKIIPRYQGGDEPMLVVGRQGHDRGTYQTCAAANDVVIGFIEDVNKPASKYRLGELHEVVPAAR